MYRSFRSNSSISLKRHCASLLRRRRHCHGGGGIFLSSPPAIHSEAVLVRGAVVHPFSNYSQQQQQREHFYSTRSRLFQSSGRMLSSSNSNVYEDDDEHYQVYGDDNDDKNFDDELWNELEQYAASSLGGNQPISYGNSRRQEPSREENSNYVSGLDLELGENSVWDEWEDSAYYDDEVLDQEQEETSINSASNSNVKDGRKLSPLDMLQNFDPNHPPFSIDSILQEQQQQGEDHAASSSSLHDVQLWLECEAQREAVMKYRTIMDSARDREDYVTIGPLKDQLMKWFVPLTQQMQQLQKDYHEQKEEEELKQKTITKPKQKLSKKEQNKIRQYKKTIQKYGHVLDMIDPEKLAIILSHEALSHALINHAHDSYPSRNNSGGGCTFVSMATQIGQAIEDEIIIQTILQQRKQQRKLFKQITSQEEEEQEQLEEEERQLRLLQQEQDMRNFDHSNTDITTTTALPTSTNQGKRWSTYTETHLKEFMLDIAQGSSSRQNNNPKYAINLARKILLEQQQQRQQMMEQEEEEEQPREEDDDEILEWSAEKRVQIGSLLLQVLCQVATVHNTNEPAFHYENRWIGKNNSRSFIVLHDSLYKMGIMDDYDSVAATTMRHKPMVLPPKKWTNPKSGGYTWLKVDLVRYHGSSIQKEAIQKANLDTVFDGLNVLGREPWKINQTILNVAQQCWDQNVSLGDIPSQTDFEVPPIPNKPTALAQQRKNNSNDNDNKTTKREKYLKAQEYKAYNDAMNKYHRIRQKNMDLVSLRCSAILKLSQAEKFKDFPNIYFPYNMDFRGRAYPIPPHLSNVGSDLCRGMLQFAKEKPLGKRGLYWLKVHFANLAGKDKMSFDDRAEYTNQNLDHIRKSIENPLEYTWWMKELDDPFQGLATCHEIINAIDSKNPETYMCSLPVHMDGSCNGLQHYAALGRDVVGGKAVNLLDFDEPQDVYIGVMHEVIRRVKEDAERHYEFSESDDSLSKEQKKLLRNVKSAKLVNGLIDRGVVKRTVMTSVYGVTYIGARQQIQEKIEEKLEEHGHDLDEINHEVFQACGYLASVTMDAIGNLFTGAQETMNWLTECARIISRKGYPVAWVSPIGLPAVQPYRQKRKSRIVTVMNTVTMAEHSDDLPIHKTRQVSAFPPNYVHSLDASHMLMTALEMDRRGLSFSAVHDSFWTHPCDVDEMNETLRECFVELYEQPLLECLKESFELRYPDVDFPDLPERGDLDIDEVKKAKFFFQ